MTRSLLLVLCLPLAGACSSSDPQPSCHGAPETCRASCGYGSGDLGAATLADVRPRAIPIDHIVLVMQENRTFDHYFSSLTVPGQTVDGARPDVTNPDPVNPGSTISRFHQTAACFDNPAESWDDVHREVHGGARWLHDRGRPRGSREGPLRATSDGLLRRDRSPVLLRAVARVRDLRSPLRLRAGEQLDQPAVLHGGDLVRGHRECRSTPEGRRRQHLSESVHPPR